MSTSIRNADAIRAGLNADLLKAYRAARQRDFFAVYLGSAQGALREARHAVEKVESDFNWTPGGSGRGDVLYSFRYTRAGLEYLAEIIADTMDTDTSHLGAFSERQMFAYVGYGAEHLINAGRSPGDYSPEEKRRRRDKSVMYETPARPDSEAIATSYRDMHRGGRMRVWYVSDVRYQDQRECYLSTGRASADRLARLSIKAGLRALLDIYGEHTQYVGVKVTVYGAGVELGESSVWGVEFDGRDFSYIDECARDMEAGATSEARRVIDGAIEKLGERLTALRDVRTALKADEALEAAGAPALSEPARVPVEDRNASPTM